MTHCEKVLLPVQIYREAVKREKEDRRREEEKRDRRR